MTNTITLNGNATGYGASWGAEEFVLNGYDNTVLLGGANDTINLASGGNDLIDLNATGFSNSVTDTIDLGQGAFDSIIATNALNGANLTIANGFGGSTIDLVNHYGSTSLTLGNQGALVNHAGLGLNDVVTLNGDAANNVTFTSGEGADVTIGAAGDGDGYDASSVALFGVYNQLLGGDETFTVTDASGLNQIALGNGDNSILLGGDQNDVVLGNGNNNVDFTGGHDALAAGTGNNDVTVKGPAANLTFAAGGAGSSDVITLTGGTADIHGGDENFSVAASHGGDAVILGNGNNLVDLPSGWVTLGSSVANTAENTVTLSHGNDHVTLNGGLDQVTLHDVNTGYDTVKLNGTLLGTQLNVAGSFDNVTLTADANAAITEAAGASGLNLVLHGDASLGIGTVSVTGLAQDFLAHITLIGTGAYTITADNTAAGGVTLHFGHGSLDLIGLQAVPNTLITVLPAH